MSDTLRLSLPLLMPSQAQKHITVNEAMLRLDAAVNLVLRTVDQTTPPEVPPEGVVFGVPQDAVNDWSGQGGKVAIGQAGGWVFMTPLRGWRAFIEDRGAVALHDGVQWQAGAVTLSPSGAGVRKVTDEFLHEIVPGAENTVAWQAPHPVMLIGVTARVVEAFTGTATSWSLGLGSATDRFGNGLGVSADSWCRGLLTTPTTLWSPEALVMTAHGGTFVGGSVRIAVHYIDLMLPQA